MDRKYKRGKQITSLDDLDKSDATFFIVLYGSKEKTTHAGWLESWQYRALKMAIKSGRIYEAELIDKGMEEKKNGQE